MSELQPLFQPNLEKSFAERFETFKNELLYLADDRFKDYFESRDNEVDFQKTTHRLWHYVQPDLSKDGGQQVAVLLLKKGSDLPKDISAIFEATLYKHFPGRESNPMLTTIFF